MVINTVAWSTTPADDVRMNRVTNIANIGTVLAGLDKTKFGLLICTSDGSGLIKDHVYLCNAAGDSLIDLTGTANHLHNQVAGQGGSILDIYSSNNDFYDLMLTKTNDLDTTGTTWNKTTTSTGSISNDTDGTTGERSIRLATGATSGSSATVTYPHLKMGFDNPALFQTKIRT